MEIGITRNLIAADGWIWKGSKYSGRSNCSACVSKVTSGILSTPFKTYCNFLGALNPLLHIRLITIVLSLAGKVRKEKGSSNVGGEESL